MLTLLRRANAALRSLPVWLKVVIAVQSLLPGVVLWFQKMYLISQANELFKTAEMIDKLRTQLPEAQYDQFAPLAIGILEAGLPGSQAFKVLVYTNFALALIGFAILLLMFWPQKTKPAAPEANITSGQPDPAHS